MPEGHTVHRLAGALTELFSGLRPKITSPQGRFAQGAAKLDGQVALPAEAWGKHFFMPFAPEPMTVELGEDGPDWLHVHLGLYGSWSFDGDTEFIAEDTIGAPRRKIGEQEKLAEGDDERVMTDWEPPIPRDTVRIRLAQEHGIADLTGPNQCRVLDGSGVRTVLNRLGPDPLRNYPGDRERFISLVRKRRVPVGQLVLDQAVTAGPGNIYRADCLFRVGINPLRPGNRVSEARLGLLWDDLVSAMNEGKRDGIILTNPPEYVPEDPADEDDRRFAVYHRTGRACWRCGTKIVESDMAGRRLFWCPGCQR
ncbi:Fpg/Nei family DNA glycosylase [Flaviflexus ciconiae]|uniref:DNA-(apurinic or apyrimidinic site) lyase n=1 Tax=Flaviflexus ciconiae TaxID=2496867 RepID=A0A3S9PZK1_9ACTO|nr:Fpg/Nei family DNA glycosylase [Flaviflexus ciconiae]AZQ77789.1 Fpg/Nei family DNA glycosylase [Flaviflexus ciconiae]